jgi:SAM-dependent methyltransferase
VPDAIDTWPRTRAHDFLRAYSDAVNSELVARWLPAALESILKTDAFDEATGTGLFPTLRSRAAHVVAVDTSAATLAAAKARYPDLETAQADVRRLQFAAASFDAVVSNSTLDHLDSADELALGIRELARVLRPGGVLVLTLDNPRNPLVALRNSLPYPLLRRLGLIHYTMGATVDGQALQGLVVGAGLEVTDVAAVMHLPRVVVLALASVVPRRPLLRVVLAAEKMRTLRPRELTAQFVGVRAVKA